ncbi:MAG: UshA like [Bacteroidetes bacterium]|nr:UshA like [Bacteroidota bacterium]
MKSQNIIFLLLFVGFSLQAQTTKKVVIIHTNDTHSRIEPLPNNGNPNPNTAGVVRRATYIDQVRKENKNVLLLDAGDFVQGTPYFNLFKGEVEIGAMNRMKYDAGTLGNHEFDYGLDVLAQIVKKANYPIVNCNYDFSNTPLRGLVKPYVILKKFGMKIGVLGVGVNPEGLVQSENYKGMVFNPIISSVNKYSEILKNQEKCDLVICLSHIGFESYGNAANDQELAKNSKFIDIIIGGHSHTYLEKPVVFKNVDGKDVLVYQMGKNGSFVGRIDAEMQEVKPSK